MLGPLALRLEHYMDLLSARQKLVASNLANIDTPGFHTKDIDFAAEYAIAGHSADPITIDAPGLKERPDGNNVDIDRESRLLAENTIRFNLASTLLHGQIKSIRNAIQEGRGA